MAIVKDLAYVFVAHSFERVSYMRPEVFLVN